MSLMLPLISAVMEPDTIHTNEMIARVCGFFGIQSHKTFVIVCIIGLILIFIFKNMFLVLGSYARIRFVSNNRFATQQRLLHAFFNRPYEYYLNATSSEIVRIVQSDASQVYYLLLELLMTLSEVIVSFVLVITIFVIDWKMTSFVAAMMGLLMFIIAKVVKPTVKKAGLEYQKSFSDTYKWLLQGVDGIKEIKVSGKERFFEENYQISGRKMIHAEKTSSVFKDIPRLLIEMISICSMLALIAIEILLGREIPSLIPTLGAFAMAAVKLLPSANRIVNSINSITYNMPAVDKLIEHLDALSDIEKEGLTYDRPAKDGIDLSVEDKIELHDITYHYPNTDKNILENASMVIPVGRSVGIVGTSGAGKTTAVDIMLGLLRPQEGCVTVDGVDVMNDYNGWLSHIGYIPQMIFMLDDSIRTNVAFGVPADKVDDGQVWHCLEEAKLADFVRTLPEGLDTRIGERGIRISGGQRQRIGIARALYENPDLLLFDEATSALDNETEAAIMESINSLHGKKTMVIIAHRLQTIEGCDMVYRVKDGRIERER